MSTVQFKRAYSDVIMPKKGSAEAACFDIYSYSMKAEGRGYTVDTGLSIALPPGHVMLLFPRSGLATKLGLTLLNTVGVIDEDYRGQLVVKFDRGDEAQQAEINRVLQHGHRVAQALILPVPHMVWTETQVLPESVRGTGGFGSSGVA